MFSIQNNEKYIIIKILFIKITLKKKPSNLEILNKINNIDNKINNIDNKINNIDNKINNIDNKINNIDNKINNIDNKINNIDNKINNKLDYIQNTTRIYGDIFSDMILYKDKEKIFCLLIPEFDNAEYNNPGDNAIVYAEIKLLKDIFPNKIILKYTLNDILMANNLIQKIITDKDILFLHGGGNLGNLYMTEENLRRYIIKFYNKNQIIILPQTIYFTEDENGKKELEISKNIYNSHENLTIMTRDEKSYQFAKEHFNSNIVLCPDSVFYLHNKIKLKSTNRNGVIFILRDDKEKILDNDLVNSIKQYLNSIDKNYFFYDNYMGHYKKLYKFEIKDYVFERLNKISEYKLCITDRLHGLIFSYITNTPCIAFNNLDRKVEGTAKWLENVEWIYKADINDFNKIKEFINKYLSNNNTIEKHIDFNKKIKDIFIDAVGDKL